MLTSPCQASKWGQRCRRPQDRLHVPGRFWAIAIPVASPKASVGIAAHKRFGSAFQWFSKEPAFIARPPRRRPVPSGGWSGSCDRFLPPGGSVTASPPCRSGLSVPLRAEAFRFPYCRSQPLVKRPADCAPLAASAVRQIQAEAILRRVFRHCCGHRCQILSCTFSLSVSTVSRRNFKCGITLSTPESCSSKVSRASRILQRRSHICGQVRGWTCGRQNPAARRNSIR